MNHENLLKLNDMLKPDLINSLSIDEGSVSIIEKIIRTLGINTEGFSKKQIENIISNYVFISEEVRLDLIEIEERIKQLKILDVDGIEEYTRKKYRYFSQLNKNARDKIISFISTEFGAYLLSHKNIDYYLCQDDTLSMLTLNSRYEYAYYKKYFDYNYDFSSEAKFLFTPRATIFQTTQIIEKYAKLKKTCIESYYTEIRENNIKINLSEHLSNIISKSYYISKRSEIFSTLSKLYNEEKYQSFISLAVLQIEGLFHDFCVLNNKKNFCDNTGTLVEKAGKVLTSYRPYELAIYPYYAFEVPIMRNEIAHKGIIDGFDLQQLSNEILLDLNAIITQIHDKINNKYLALIILFEKLESLEDKSESNIAENFLQELFLAYQVHDSEFILVLRDPYNYEIEYTESLYLSELCSSKFSKDIDDLIRYLSGLIFGQLFWDALKTQVQKEQGIKENYKKSPDFISFAIELRNNFIGKLENKTKVKITCQEISSLLSN